MYRIATLNKISKVGLTALSEAYMLTEKVEEADGILVRSQDMLNMEFSSQLKAIARAGAGVNNIPLDRCAEQGIVVFNTPGANANAVKELTISALFLAARHIPAALSWAGTLTEDVAKTVEKGKSQFAGTEIAGKTLGVVGLGAIGRKVAAVAAALGMRVVGYDPYVTDAGVEGLSVLPDIEALLAESEYVTIHVPATPATNGMFNRALFAAMRPGTVLLNFSRDKLVNDVDLLVAIEAGQVSQYITDFPNDTLVGRPGVVLLPHLGASTEEAEDTCARMAVEELRDYFENGNIVNSVNFPRVELGPLAQARVAILTKDIEAPAQYLTGQLSAAGLEVARVAGGTRGAYGYALAELTSGQAPKLLFKDTAVIAHRELTR